MTKEISLKKLSALADGWLAQGGLPLVELAAMEPTLWRDGDHSFLAIVNVFSSAGYQVNLTTNGSTIAQYAAPLANLSINKIRISWHSLNPQLYEKITGGSYENFLNGIQSCVEYKLPICYNRVLFKGFTDDIASHIDIVDQQKSRIKFLELYFTEQNKPFFDKYHMTLHDFSKLVESDLPLTRAQNFTPEYATRCRYIWETPNGGRVEFKVAESRSKPTLCSTCPFVKNCIEGFAEYFRVTPCGDAAFCYLRSDFDVPLFQGNAVDFSHATTLLEQTGIDFKDWISHRSLRLIPTSSCNYNCSFPNGEAFFCLGKRFRTI